MGEKKILLFGATGMAGHMAYYYLQSTQKYHITNITYRSKLTKDSIIIDVTDRKSVADIIRITKPDYILNCIGVLIKGSNEHPDNAILINAYFPHLLKKLADEVGAKLIHISTDCVFSGKKGNYIESDFRDADDIYGRSKALGEIINDKDLTIRTSIIGPELKKNGNGLFHWFMQQKGDINGYSSVIWSGVTTLELSKAIEKSIDSDLSGLVHLSNGIEINKFQLLQRIKNIWEKDINIIEDNSVFQNKSIQKTDKFNFHVPSYEIMMYELYSWMIENKRLYQSNYF